MRWAILLLIVCPFAVQAAFYKCKDEDGNVVFSDTACSTQGDREQVNVRQAPPPRQQPQEAPTWAARAQAADQAKADSEYQKQRAKLVRELDGTTVSTNQSLGKMMKNKKRRNALKEEIDQLDRQYLMRKDPAAAQRHMERREIEQLEAKVKRLEKKNKRASRQPTQLHERFGKVYDSQGRRCTKLYDTWTCQ
jgi:predicted RNase H-like nuclease (RuvC/YqgF family)